jgi:hypothetical protein
MQMYAISHGVDQRLAFYTIPILNGTSVGRFNRSIDFQIPRSDFLTVIDWPYCP